MTWFVHLLVGRFVDWLVGWSRSVGWSVCHKSLKEREVLLYAPIGALVLLYFIMITVQHT